jgi:hypothetical protein
MRVYFAARFSQRFALRQFRQQLEALGHIVTSRWIDADSEDPAALALCAQEDLVDIITADIIVSFTEEPRGDSRGARHCEFGIGLALNLKGFEATSKPPRPKGGRPKGSSKPRERKPDVAARHEKIVALADAGVPTSTIAAEVGVALAPARPATPQGWPVGRYSVVLPAPAGALRASWRLLRPSGPARSGRRYRRPRARQAAAQRRDRACVWFMKCLPFAGRA